MADVLHSLISVHIVCIHMSEYCIFKIIFRLNYAIQASHGPAVTSFSNLKFQNCIG